MEAFACPVDKKKLRYTNEIWNRLRLNSRWSIGSVTSLIQQYTFESKEEWMAFYYESGLHRSRICRNLPKTYRDATSNHRMIAPNIHRLPQDIIALNYGYGRTKKELELRAREMHDEIKKLGNPYKITLKECIQMVEYRVIGETWNGFVLRKENTRKTLQKRFPLLDFRKSTVEGVDFEVYQNRKLIGALQIKPQSFKTNHISVANTHKQINSLQQQAFESAQGVPALIIYADTKGRIENPEDLNKFIKTEAVV